MIIFYASEQHDDDDHDARFGMKCLIVCDRNRFYG